LGTSSLGMTWLYLPHRNAMNLEHQLALYDVVPRTHALGVLDDDLAGCRVRIPEVGHVLTRSFGLPIITALLGDQLETRLQLQVSDLHYLLQQLELAVPAGLPFRVKGVSVQHDLAVSVLALHACSLRGELGANA